MRLRGLAARRSSLAEGSGERSGRACAAPPTGWRPRAGPPAAAWRPRRHLRRPQCAGAAEPRSGRRTHCAGAAGARGGAGGGVPARVRGGRGMRRSRACAHGLPWWLQVTRTYVRACVRAHAHRTHALIGAGGPEGCSPWQDGCGWRGVVEAGRPAGRPARPPALRPSDGSAVAGSWACSASPRRHAYCEVAVPLSRPAPCLGTLRRHAEGHGLLRRPACAQRVITTLPSHSRPTAPRPFSIR